MANKTYKNILVPFDNSKISHKALKVAKILSKSFDSTLHIVMVVDISNVASPGMIRSKDTKSLEQIRASVKQSVRAIIKQKEEECSAEKIKVKVLVVEGTIVNEILKSIKENNIDLVVIGSRGLSGLSKMMALGSVSRKISEIADCPVMVIR